MLSTAFCLRLYNGDDLPRFTEKMSDKEFQFTVLILLAVIVITGIVLLSAVLGFG